MEFLPMPQNVSFKEGTFSVNYRTVIVLNNTELSSLLYAQLLRDAVLESTCLELQIVKGKYRAGDIVLTTSESMRHDSYTIDIDERNVIITGGSDESLLHGVMTLRQCIMQCGTELPAVVIQDYPDMPNRGYYQDCARGRIPTLAQLKKTADILCQYKINEWQLYVENTYMFRDISESWRGDTPLTAEEIMELDSYCAARHIDLVPSLASFGHMFTILSTKTCQQYCEYENSDKVPFSFKNTMRHHTVSVSNPDTMDFIKDLITEYKSLFTSKKFNICCDETFDLGKGRSKNLADEKGSHNLYVDYVAELCSWLIAQGITPQFWGDIILHHPETYAKIPKGTVCLNWNYSPDVDEAETKTFAEAGAVQYVCPGIWSWRTFIPMMEEGFENIKRMCQYGSKYNAIGLLNTDWGDWGHLCPSDLSIPGILYGAAFSWNSKDISFEKLNNTISLLLYGDATGSTMKAFNMLSRCDISGFGWKIINNFIEASDDNSRKKVLESAKAEKLPQVLSDISNALSVLNTAALNARYNKDFFIELRIMASGIEIFDKVGIYLCDKYEVCPSSINYNPMSLASDLEYWINAYSQQWRSISKESMLKNIQSVVIKMADLLREREITLDADYFVKK